MDAKHEGGKMEFKAPPKEEPKEEPAPRRLTFEPGQVLRTR